MLSGDQVSLARQLDLVFKELNGELLGLHSGVVFVQIRNNVIGKFGIRHHPLAFRGESPVQQKGGLSVVHIASFRRMALESLSHKRNWTHGEIGYEFAVRQGAVVVDATFESNYNMANVMIRYQKKPYYSESAGNE